MNRVCIGLTLLAIVGALELGCGNACDNATERIRSRYTECDITVSEASGSEASASAQCSDSDGRYADCLADCAESAKCEALSGTDPLAGADLGECNGDCQ